MSGKHRSSDSTPNRWVVSFIAVLLPVVVVGGITVVFAPAADSSTTHTTLASWSALPPRAENDLDTGRWTPPPAPPPTTRAKPPRIIAPTIEPEEHEEVPEPPSLAEQAAEGPDEAPKAKSLTGGEPCSTADLSKPAAGPHVANHVAAAARHVVGVFSFGWASILGVGGRAIAGSDHPKGLAIDFMVFKDKAKGDKVAAYVLDHVDMLSVKYVIWYQRINYGDGKGWHAMADRGGTTANHKDHVHVSFNSKGPSEPIMCTS